MIDGILHRLRRTGERVQRRSEEVAQSARLRLDVFQLNRELDALYARLGRSYHAQGAVSVLEGIRADIGRVEDEIASRERLLSELSDTQVQEPEEGQATPSAAPAPSELRISPFVPIASTLPSSGHSAPPAQAALSVWHEKEAARMSSENNVPEGSSVPGNPNESGNPEKPEVTGNAVGVGDEAARERLYRHPNTLKEGEAASRSPDPLAIKD